MKNKLLQRGGIDFDIPRKINKCKRTTAPNYSEVFVICAS